MIGRGRDNEAGQGLGYVLVISTVLLVFLIALVDVLRREMTWVVKASRSTALLHQADAAVDRAMYALQKSGNWDALPSGAVSGYLKDVTYTDIPTLKYTVKVQPGNWTPYKPSMGSEDAWTPAGDVKLQRTITVYVTFTATGEHKKLQAVVLKSSVNSAIFSGGQISFGGNADVNWGPVVSYSTASDSIIAGKNGSDHPVFLSEGGIQGLPASMTNVKPNPGSAQAGVSYDSGDTTGSLGVLPVPDWDFLRSTAKKQGAYHYYSNDPLAPGGDPQSTAPVWNLPNKITWPVFDTSSVIFFDTCNESNYDPATMSICSGGCNPPTAVGCKLGFSGQECGYGTLVIMGDMDNSGGGNCSQGLDGNNKLTPPTDCARYDADLSTCGTNAPTYKQANIVWDGLVYIAGKIYETGNYGIYGTVYAGGSGGGSGTISIYYKSQNTEIGLLGQSVLLSLWMERTPLPTDVFP